MKTGVMQETDIIGVMKKTGIKIEDGSYED